METENFYTTYNARHLAPKEVAKSFIWSESFDRLTGNNHSIILGARGCGKTTLMKMLTLPALYSWQFPEAKDYRDNIPFYSIYVSTDIYWNVKNKNYGMQLEKYGNFSERVSRFAVNSNVFSSVCDTFLNIIQFEIENPEEDKEIEIAKELISAWKLESVPPRIRYVKEALNTRIDEVNQLIQEIIFNYGDEDKINLPSYFNLYFESSLERIIPKFERIYGLEGEGRKKWALCFDELEFAPLWLQKTLFQSLRSRTQFLLYKLSASPILPSELENTLLQDYGPTAGNDVDMIKMWSNPDNEEFSKKIILSIIGKDVDLKSFFGTNDIYNKKPNSYIEGSSFFKEMRELYEKDFSFRKFLVKKKVDLKDSYLNDNKQKDILFRKIKPIVYFRNTFIKSNKEGLELVKRHRKSVPNLYYGIEVLSKVCDGNPRWLIGIVKQLLSKSKNEPPNKTLQYDQLNETAHKFRNVIANIPVGDSSFTVENLLDKIAEFFNHEVLGDEFKMDPKGTVKIDGTAIEENSNLPQIIEKAVAQGALILLNDNSNSFDFKVKEKRFKLSFLYSIIYDLPIRKYPSINLSDCMKGVQEDNSGQFNLFNK